MAGAAHGRERSPKGLSADLSHDGDMTPDPQRHTHVGRYVDAVNPTPLFELGGELLRAHGDKVPEGVSRLTPYVMFLPGPTSALRAEQTPVGLRLGASLRLPPVDGRLPFESLFVLDGTLQRASLRSAQCEYLRSWGPCPSAAVLSRGTWDVRRTPLVPC